MAAPLRTSALSNLETHDGRSTTQVLANPLNVHEQAQMATLLREVLLEAPAGQTTRWCFGSIVISPSSYSTTLQHHCRVHGSWQVILRGRIITNLTG